MGGQQGWRQRESTAWRVAAQKPALRTTDNEDDAVVETKKSDPWKWRRRRLVNQRGKEDDDRLNGEERTQRMAVETERSSRTLMCSGTAQGEETMVDQRKLNQSINQSL